MRVEHRVRPAKPRRLPAQPLNKPHERHHEREMPPRVRHLPPPMHPHHLLRVDLPRRPRPRAPLVQKNRLINRSRRLRRPRPGIAGLPPISPRRRRSLHRPRRGVELRLVRGKVEGHGDARRVARVGFDVVHRPCFFRVVFRRRSRGVEVVVLPHVVLVGVGDRHVLEKLHVAQHFLLEIRRVRPEQMQRGLRVAREDDAVEAVGHPVPVQHVHAAAAAGPRRRDAHDAVPEVRLRAASSQNRAVYLVEPPEREHFRRLAQEPLLVVVEEPQLGVVKDPRDHRRGDARGLVPRPEEERDERVHDVVPKRRGKPPQR
mmetsp:Transcript_18066/g.45688  ORF Transcript_18066/g.45688 Transcript_18066/m.45688 type:complete len:316 (+) Transcript_18066:389-1336(+)